ncbi:hypothetical protein ABTN19_19185, partial [Acinetobacter baumannii]
ISIFMALFEEWNKNHFISPVHISRSKIMRTAKIHSPTTYHQCIQDLQQLGYIAYFPSYHPRLGSAVYLLDFHTYAEGSNHR